MLELVRYAPALHTRSKTRDSDHDVERGVRHLAQIWQGDPMDVRVGRRHAGVMWGDEKVSLFWPNARMSLSGNILYDTEDEAIKKRSRAGGNWPLFFCKIDASRANVKWWDLWAAAGRPQAGDYSGTARTARAFTNSTKGANKFPDCSPSRRFLTRVSCQGTNQYSVVIPYDRVIAYDACSISTSSQNMTNTTAAPRWISAGQRGLKASVWIDVTNGTGAFNLSAVSYTNMAGTSGRLVSTTPALAKAASLVGATTNGAINAFTNTQTNARPFLEFQAGDTGIKQIDSYQWSGTQGTGTVSFLLAQPYFIQVFNAQTGLAGDDDLMSGIAAYENSQIFDGACISYMWWMNTTGGSSDIMWLETGVS